MNSNLRNSHREPLETSPSKFSPGSRFLRKNSLSRSQNFDDGSAKISNLDDSHNIMSPHLPDIAHDHSDSNQKKIEANFKHTLGMHEIGNIIEGKRNRKPPEPLMNNNSNSKQIVQHNHHQTNHHAKTLVPKPVSRPESAKKEQKVVEIPKQKALTPQNRRNEVRALNFSEVFVNGKTRSQKRKMSMPNPVLQHQAIPVKKVMREPVHTKAPKVEEEVQEESSEEIENEEEDFRPKAQKVIKGHEVNSMRSSRAMELARREKEERKAAQNNLKTEKQNNLEEEKVENRIVPNRLVRQVAVKEVNMEEFLKKEEKAMALNKSYQRPGTYMNCDLRYFNFDFLVDKLGYFDVILMDPPWRIKGAQQNDSSFMFSNSKFNLEYDTLSNQEIINLKVERLSKKGFLFLWILSNQINVAYEMLNKWGYEVVDQIVWVKLKDSKVYLSHGYYFMHSFEMCLVGYKCPPGESIEYNTKICNDVMFGEVRTKSRKPDELYEIIDFMMPGSRKIELFARNHNLRPGWFSLGNQLGETFEKWHNEVQCNNCAQRIYIGIKRYKSRYESDYDLCEKCFKTGNLNPDDFFMMNNLVNEDVLHHYHSCNNCLTEPIWGTRFTCQDCENFDLCECCYDKNLRNEKRVHDVRHNFKVVEVPILANGLPAHRNIKCAHCFQKPIIGVRFKCSECPNLSFCQNCFFSKPQDEMKKYRGHKQHHNFQILAEPVQVETQIYKCNWCEIDPIQDTVFKCENCFSFFFCEKCFAKKDYYKPNTANTHKYYHTFVTVDGSE